MDDPLTPGTWKGFWTYYDAPERHGMRLDAASGASGHFEAAGEDEVGPFTLSGRLGEEPGRWALTKQYVGKHEVRYQAQHLATGFVGRWYVQDLCGGAFVLWPGESEASPPELFVAMPRVEFISRATRWGLVGLDWAALCIGLIGIILWIRVAATRQGALLGYLLFAAYLTGTSLCERWILRRVIRRALGTAGKSPELFKAPPGGDWKRPVTPSQVLAALLTIAALVYTLWMYFQKRWPGTH